MIAFVFPGQGAQKVGMGKSLASEFPVCRAAFDEADAALGQPLSSLCFEGPEDRLLLTENTQPAILAMSVAVCRLVESEGIRADFAAGHSLGEYSAHVVLDEISDIPLSTQVKLLRVLQEKEIERVGGERTITVDVRIISATNRDLAPMVEKGEFREDLFYRLHIIPIEVPPLRERKEDILPLVTHFITSIGAEMAKSITGLTDESMELLMRYDWPGNIRELENMIERAIVLCESDRLDASLFPINERRAPRAGSTGELGIPPAGAMTLDDALERIERTMIEDALEKSGGVKTRTAELLGIKTSALYYKLEKYGLTGGQAS